MNKTMIYLGAVLLLTGCTHSGKTPQQEFKEAGTGLWYKILEDKEGKTIQEDDFVGLSYTESTEEGTVLYNSADEDGRMALMFRERSYFPGDLFAGLGMLSEGDSASFKVSLDALVAHQQRPRPQTKGKYLVYAVKIHKVVGRDSLNDSSYNAAITAFKDEQLVLAKTQEPEKLSRYISARHLKPAVSPSGLGYIIHKKGSGPVAHWGDTVLVSYTAMYLSEKVIETSDAGLAKKAGIYNKSRQYGPLKLLMQKNGTLSGFDEALMMFPKGTSYTLIIPSKLAYGENGNNNIKPYTALICKAEILDIIK